MKLLVDMNLSPRWATDFASAITAVHWSTVGAGDASDTEVMAYAKEHGFVVLTNDLDYPAILAASGADGPSVVLIRSGNLDPSVIGRDVLGALIETMDALQQGAVVTIALGYPTRVHTLPLRKEPTWYLTLRADIRDGTGSRPMGEFCQPDRALESWGMSASVQKINQESEQATLRHFCRGYYRKIDGPAHPVEAFACHLQPDPTTSFVLPHRNGSSRSASSTRGS